MAEINGDMLAAITAGRLEFSALMGRPLSFADSPAIDRADDTDRAGDTGPAPVDVDSPAPLAAASAAPVPAGYRAMVARFAGRCRQCGGYFDAGAPILFSKSAGARHAVCPATATPDVCGSCGAVVHPHTGGCPYKCNADRAGAVGPVTVPAPLPAPVATPAPVDSPAPLPAPAKAPRARKAAGRGLVQPGTLAPLPIGADDF